MLRAITRIMRDREIKHPAKGMQPRRERERGWGGRSSPSQPASQQSLKRKWNWKWKKEAPARVVLPLHADGLFFFKASQKKINLSPIDINRGLERGREFPFSCRALTDSFSFCLLVSTYARIAYWCVFDSFFLRLWFNKKNENLRPPHWLRLKCSGKRK